MPHRDFVPGKDADLLSYATNYSAKVTATPTAYGLVAADATALAALVSAYSAALAEATNPDTRTSSKVAMKNLAKAHLVADIRALSRKVQASTTVTVEQLSDLGLPIHKHQPTPIPAPATMPLVNVVTVRHGSHVIRLADETTPTSRAKPFGVDGAEVLVFVGETPPADIDQWEIKGLATRAQFQIDYDSADAGKTAHIIARWFNPRGHTGPNSVPVTERIAA